MTSLFALGSAQTEMLQNGGIDGQATGSVGVEVGADGQISAETAASVNMAGPTGALSADAWTLYKS